MTFGQVFVPGQVPAGTPLGARLPNGSQVPLQTDLKAAHADGSMRHAVFTVILPGLPAGGSERVTLFVAAEPLAGDAVSLDDLLSGDFDAAVTLSLGGTPWGASARGLLQSGAPAAWLSGPLVSEWRVSAPLTDPGGAAHPHLSVIFNIRAYQGLERVRADVVVENAWAYEPGPQNFTYDAAVSIDGAQVYEKDGLTHFAQARWRKVFWEGEAPLIHVKHDAAYMMSTGAVPAYDGRLVVPEAALAEMDAEWTGEITEPMGAGLVEPYMPETGGRRDIGPLPQWAVRYLLSMDERAARATLGTADLAGSWPIHYRDKDTGLPVSLQDYPYMTLLGNYGDTLNPETGQYEAFPDCGGDCSTPFTPDSAHQPGLAYLPYLVTGDYFYLEELQFWANWNLLESNPYYREFEQGLLQWGQVRGQAWSLRTLGQAAYITPDAHPMKGYFIDRLRFNIDWYLAQYPGNPDANPLGVLANGYAFAYSEGRGVAPWQDDFFTWSAGYMVELGFSDALPLLGWKSIFPVGRMTDGGFCRIFAPIYSMIVRGGESEPVYATLAEAYEASIRESYADDADAILGAECAGADMGALLDLAPGEMVGYSDSATGYPSNMQIALAAAADSGIPGAAEAWDLFIHRPVQPDYGPEPQFAVVSRAFPP